MNGNFVNGVVKYKDGTTYKGYVEKGLRHGESSEYIFPDGDRFAGKFEADKFVEGTYQTAAGYKYEGKFENNQMNGEGKLFLRDKLVYEGQFKNNLFHGVGVYTNPDSGAVYDGKFVEGKK